MKKAAHLLLLIPVLLHAGGIMLICIILQLNVQHNVHTILENHETKLEKLSLTCDEYKRAKLNKKEIMLDGRMYDIKQVRFHDDRVELIAYHDKKEQGLISIIENLFSPENSKKDLNIQILKLLASVFTFEKLAIAFDSPELSDALGFPIQKCYRFFSEDVFSPPPEV